MDGAQPGDLALDLDERVVAGPMNAKHSAFTSLEIVEPVGRVLRDVQQGQLRAAEQPMTVEGCPRNGLVRLCAVNRVGVNQVGRQIFERARVLAGNRIASVPPKSTVR
jgi:hypothetical protein